METTSCREQTGACQPIREQNYKRYITLGLVNLSFLCSFGYFFFFFLFLSFEVRFFSSALFWFD